MKNYTITVNGNVYDVTVEENEAGAMPMASIPKMPAPPVKTAPAALAAPAAPAPAGAQGKVKVNAPMPGKILEVKRGQVILVLEAMKMENEVVAPEDGTVATINVSVGDSVESGVVLATLN